MRCPLIAHALMNGSGHYIAIVGINSRDGSVVIYDPAQQHGRDVPKFHSIAPSMLEGRLTGAYLAASKEHLSTDSSALIWGIFSVAIVATAVAVSLSQLRGASRWVRMAPLLAIVYVAGCDSGVAPSSVQKEIELDLGIIAPGSTKEVQAAVENVFDTPLRIVDIKTSCQCTTAELEVGAIIPANTKHFFKVLVDGSSRNTEVSTKLLISGEAGHRTSVTLFSIHGKVVGDVVAVPASVDFGDIPYGRSVSRQIAIHSVSDEVDLEECRAHVHLDGLRVRSLPVDGRSATYLFIVDKSLPLGAFASGARVVDSRSGKALLTIPVNGRVVGDVEVLPSTLHLQKALRSGFDASRYALRLTSVGGVPFTIVSASSPAGVTANIPREVVESDVHRIEVEVRGDYVREDGDYIQLKLGNLSVSTLRVPLL
ncbi:hypothetical protein Spa11_00670 [Botrimarina mediterranea]|uniref:DUF1573 domain-containing protein n=2 Tax=Botrimarina mediterranea TaxID=2528022 RepID=A0A518K256_9BACT|nr:hypothetical protein Spa11_00670 [Botrimarina mediterranea]